MSDLEAFRQETRAWLEENCPESMRSKGATDISGSGDDICWGGRNFKFQSEDQRLWLERMGGRGWTVPTWPAEYGGGGLSKDQAKVLAQELRRINARVPLVSFGIWMLGPALLKFGTEEQKKEHLPKIARGEIRWCQGYSEPNAGSDLASLATKAEDRGDHYIVNGQKVWTSYADKADWIFCLIRTNPNDKHNGISFVLFDMETPGVSTKPIKLISGSSPFCETFFDDVKVPKANLVGEENKGWTIAKYLLTHERTGISDMSGPRPLHAIAKEAIGLNETTNRLADDALRHQVAAHEIDAMSFLMTMERASDEAKAGGDMGAFSSMLKYYGTELNKARNELTLKVKGSDALEWEGQYSNGGETARSWLRSKGNSIEGGTSEIQLNIVAKRILDLPA